MFFFAFIAWKLIGDLDQSVAYDEYSVTQFIYLLKKYSLIIFLYLKSNFSSLSSAASIFYTLISFDNYPDCMLPAFSKLLISRVLSLALFFIIFNFVRCELIVFYLLYYQLCATRFTTYPYSSVCSL